MLYSLSVLFALCFLSDLVNADNWAVLVAGSSTFSNYRHQADVAHAYQLLKSTGVPAENIITMLYDDIANSPQNPFPGQIFNNPTPDGTPGVDVYAGLVTDYSGKDVSTDTFTKVLTGQPTGTGSGKVLKSTAEDTVFINFVDHGGVGIIEFPDKLFSSQELNSVLNAMNQQQLYKQLVFYMEACESGSMFDGILGSDLNIYVATASNPKESSWGTFCPPEDSVNGKHLNTCLGDLFSVSWLDNTENKGVSETLDGQYFYVKSLTNKSHVEQYGDQTWTKEPLSTFFGPNNPPKSTLNKQVTAQDVQDSQQKQTQMSKSSVSSRDIPLHLNYYDYLRHDETDFHGRLAKAQELQAMLNAQVTADQYFLALTRDYFQGDASQADDALTSSPPTGACAQDSCCFDVYDAYQGVCGKFNDYTLRYTRVLANLCHHANSLQDTVNSTELVVNHVVKQSEHCQ